MFRSYLTTALRSIRRYKGYAFINIFGLAVGLAACLLIGLYVRFELSYDRMHEKADRIVRIGVHLPNNRPGSQDWNTNLLPVAPELEASIAGVENTVRIAGGSQYAVQAGDVRQYEDELFMTEPSFFDMFDFPVVSGSAAGLDRPFTIMLSESMAQKYFPGENPLGQTMSLGEQYDPVTEDYEVVGVYADLPHNVHVRPEMLASLATRLQSVGNPWSSLAYTYVLLREGTTIKELDADVESFEKDVLQANFTEGTTFTFQPLIDIHLHSTGSTEIRPQGDIRYVWIFSGIAALILLIACINYMNLATARSVKRAREVGVRKVVGAHRGQLIRQFLSESTLFAAVALVLSVALAQMVLPVFSAMMDRSLSFDAGDFEMIGYLIAAAILVGLISGSYPAFLLSRMKPSTVLKGGAGIRSSAWLRKGLVVFQFMVSMALIVGTIVIQKQLDYVQETNLGFDKEQTIVLSTRERLGTSTEAFREELSRQAGVVGVSMTNSVPGKPVGGITYYGADDIENYEGEGQLFDYMGVDYDYFDLLGIDVVEGRAFSRDVPSDAEGAVILNETAVNALGWEDPIGKAFLDDGKREEVIGVVADFHLQSMKVEIKPMMIQVGSRYMNYAAVKVGTSDLPATLASLESVWNRFIPDLPFQYSFVDDDFDAMYRSEQRLARLFQSFSTLAIIIAALGLFGLAAFTAQQRTKEIGIRKVLGASVPGMVLMLSKDFVRLVVLAFVIAAPIAYFAMDNWLSSFVYRVDIGVDVFALAGVVALAIALGSVSWQAMRAATSNPIDSLRYE